MDGHLSGVVDSIDRDELSAQRDRVSGVFSRRDVSCSDTQFPESADVHYGVFSS